MSSPARAIRLAAGAKIPLLARMRFPRFFLGLLILSLALALSATTAEAAAKKKPAGDTGSASNSNAYKGAIVIDAATGKVLFEENADTVSPPASMVKLMTYAVLWDKLQSGALTLETPVTVTKADTKIAMLRDSTNVWLKEKEVFPVEELIYAMMIQSANDAAYALARTAGGSVEAFVELMNAKARELGMTHTTFRTPHGLTTVRRSPSEGDLTSPRDFAILSRYLVSKTAVLKYTSVKTRQFGGKQRSRQVDMRNHNHLLDHFAGLDGLKTGYTGGASFCLSATAQRNGRRVIVVVMGSPDAKTRDLNVAELINRGFAALPLNGPAFAETASTSRPTIANTASALNAQRPAFPSSSPSPIVSAPLIVEPKNNASARTIEEPAITITVPPVKK